MRFRGPIKKRRIPEYHKFVVGFFLTTAGPSFAQLGASSFFGASSLFNDPILILSLKEPVDLREHFEALTSRSNSSSRTNASNELDGIYEFFYTKYSGFEPKQNLGLWAPDAEFQKARESLNRLPADATKKAKAEIFRTLLNSPADLLVGAQTRDRKSWELPFSLVAVAAPENSDQTGNPASGHYYVSASECAAGSPEGTDSRPQNFQQLAAEETERCPGIGDELLRIEGQTPVERLAQIASPVEAATFGALVLTRRSAALGTRPLSMRAQLSFRSAKDGGEYSTTLKWLPSQVDIPIQGFSQCVVFNPVVYAPFAGFYRSTDMTPAVSQPWLLGGPTFLPRLGPNPENLAPRSSKTPTAENFVSKPYSGTSELFESYIFDDGQKHSVGFLRIPHFAPNPYFNRAWREAATRRFAQLIDQLEGSTDALVIDLQNNPGGNLYYLYALIERLSTTPLKSPLMKKTVDDFDAFIAYAYKALYDGNQVSDTATALKFYGGSIDGFRPTYSISLEQRNFLERMSGSTGEPPIELSPQNGPKIFGPEPLGGIAKIEQLEPDVPGNPSATYAHYSKPIVILLNRQSLAGAEIFAQILISNNRAIVAGAESAGTTTGVRAYVTTKNGVIAQGWAPELFIDFSKLPTFSPTSYSQPIQPTQSILVTEEDLRTGFQPYIAKLKQTLNQALTTNANSKQ